jgi:hypothetical protein
MPPTTQKMLDKISENINVDKIKTPNLSQSLMAFKEKSPEKESSPSVRERMISCEFSKYVDPHTIAEEDEGSSDSKHHSSSHSLSSSTYFKNAPKMPESAFLKPPDSGFNTTAAITPVTFSPG